MWGPKCKQSMEKGSDNEKMPQKKMKSEKKSAPTIKLEPEIEAPEVDSEHGLLFSQVYETLVKQVDLNWEHNTYLEVFKSEVQHL